MGAGCVWRPILCAWRATGGAVPWACPDSNADGCEVVPGLVDGAGKRKYLGGFFGG